MYVFYFLLCLLFSFIYLMILVIIKNIIYLFIFKGFLIFIMYVLMNNKVRGKKKFYWSKN